MPRTVIQGQSEISASWLSRVLKQRVERFQVVPGHGNWSRQLTIHAHLADGSASALRLKICLGDTFGRSEVDYYTRDYIGMHDAPIVLCLDAQYEPSVGYHLLLEDLEPSHRDRRDVDPSMAHGLAVAQSLGRMHRHHWESMGAPAEASLNRYFDEVRPGVAAIESALGVPMRDRFERHERAFRERWAQPLGMSLLHGDSNPTNILTPNSAEAPVYFLDRQPFDWSLTYGVAAWDLAYFMIPWWPEPLRLECEATVLRHWYETLDAPGYSWEQAKADWRLSVEQCLSVPLEWCSKPATLESMRWLWEVQLARVENAIASQNSGA